MTNRELIDTATVKQDLSVPGQFALNVQLGGLQPIVVQVVSARSASVSIDLTLGQYVILLLNTSISTLTITGWTSGILDRCVLEVRNQGAYSISSWAGAKWPGHSSPSVTTGSGSIDTFALVSGDGGATVLGNIVGQAYA